MLGMARVQSFPCHAPPTSVKVLSRLILQAQCSGVFWSETRKAIAELAETMERNESSLPNVVEALCVVSCIQLNEYSLGRPASGMQE
jgi:hypothetical protein